MSDPKEPGTDVARPDRARLTSEQFELVIRRAAELQAESADAGAQEGVSEAELIRIGRELGLSTQHLQRALVEVRGEVRRETGVLARLFGTARIEAHRTVQGEADAVRGRLERYLVDREFFVVQRRRPDRLVLTEAGGVAAAVGRAASQLTRRAPPLKLSVLEVVVQPLEDGYSHVTLTTTLQSARVGFASGSAIGGGGGALTVAVALGIAVAPPAALLGLPVLAGTHWAMRAAYRASARRAREQLEGLLDRLEHGEI